jgi:hypothetical protein
MLLELAKPVALLLCLLSLLTVFHTVFFTLEDPQLLLQPHQALRDRIIDSVLLLALSATLPLQLFYWATAIMLLLFPLASFLETHYIFTPTIHW